MYLKTCVCGKSKKNFKYDIGPNFVNNCCKEAGMTKSKPAETKPSKEEILASAMEAPKAVPVAETPVPADVNEDGKVDEKDLSEVHKAYAEEKAKTKPKRRSRKKKKS